MKIMDISNLNISGVFKWDRDYLFKVLTTGKNPVLKNPRLIAAFRAIDRKDFIPESLKARAYEDVDLDIGYGEDLTRPTVIAQMSELLSPKDGGNYLDIGTGTGYMALILGFSVGEMGHVYSVERVQWLWEMARQSAGKYKDIRNVTFLYRDGLKGLPNQAPFNGIHISFAMDQVPMELKMQLDMNGGRMVVPTTNNDIRVIERNSRDDFTEEIVPGFVFKTGKEGVV